MNDLISKGDFYGMPDKYTIDAGDYNDLLKSSLMLQALLNTNVSDWCGFEDACIECRRLEKELDNV